MCGWCCLRGKASAVGPGALSEDTAERRSVSGGPLVGPRFGGARFRGPAVHGPEKGEGGGSGEEPPPEGSGGTDVLSVRRGTGRVFWVMLVLFV